MATKELIIVEALSWMGTPYHHQGRVKGAGVDCAGLIVGVAKGVGLDIPDITGYSRDPDGVTLQAICEAGGKKVPFEQAQIGDVLLMKIRHQPQHLGFLSRTNPRYIIHSYAGAGKVVEHILSPLWDERVVAVYRIHGVTS